MNPFASTRRPPRLSVVVEHRATHVANCCSQIAEQKRLSAAATCLVLITDRQRLAAVSFDGRIRKRGRGRRGCLSPSATAYIG